jgi:hypothetical protein
VRNNEITVNLNLPLVSNYHMIKHGRDNLPPLEGGQPAEAPICPSRDVLDSPSPLGICRLDAERPFHRPPFELERPPPSFDGIEVSADLLEGRIPLAKQRLHPFTLIGQRLERTLKCLETRQELIALRKVAVPIPTGLFKYYLGLAEGQGDLLPDQRLERTLGC